jgi:archaellum biogenesis protein FlaJ (TadC family)
MHSAREEFGPLKDAIDNAGKKIATGSDERTAFRSMVEKIKSDNLSRAVDLIIQGIRSGGELAGILDKIADVFRDRSILSKEMRSSVLMYAIFIFFVLGMGAPVLFGISDFLVRTMTTGIGAEIPDVDPSEFATSQGASVIPTGMRGGSIVPERGASIDPDFMTMYFILGLIISSCTGSIILGQVLSGKEKAGIKFIPLLIGMSILIFFLIKYLLSLTLGSMLT